MTVSDGTGVVSVFRRYKKRLNKLSSLLKWHYLFSLATFISAFDREEEKRTMHNTHKQLLSADSKRHMLQQPRTPSCRYLRRWFHWLDQERKEHKFRSQLCSWLSSATQSWRHRWMTSYVTTVQWQIATQIWFGSGCLSTMIQPRFSAAKIFLYICVSVKRSGVLQLRKIKFEELEDNGKRIGFCFFFWQWADGVGNSMNRKDLFTRYKFFVSRHHELIDKISDKKTTLVLSTYGMLLIYACVMWYARMVFVQVIRK